MAGNRSRTFTSPAISLFSRSPKNTTTNNNAATDDEYNMKHKRRGLALIFSHEKFLNSTERTGTRVDEDFLKIELKRLYFDVVIHRNLSASDLENELKKASNKDHSDADCLVVVVMSHGEPDMIYASDGGKYPEDTLWKYFTRDKCRSLDGKPKLFFIQACRGDRMDSGKDVTDAAPFTSSKPSEADILVSHSTVKGYLSWRNSNTGSWYINALCKELKDTGKTQDILTILTNVNYRVAHEYRSDTDKSENDNMMQMPAITSLLTKLVYFRDNKF